MSIPLMSEWKVDGSICAMLIIAQSTEGLMILCMPERASNACVLIELRSCVEKMVSLRNAGQKTAPHGAGQ